MIILKTLQGLRNYCPTGEFHIIIYLHIFMQSYFSKEMEGVKKESLCEDVVFVPGSPDLEEDEEVKRRLLRKFVKSGKKIKSNIPLNQATYQNMIEYADRVGRIVRDPEFMRVISQDVTLHDLESCRIRGFYASLTAAIVDKS